MIPLNVVRLRARFTPRETLRLPGYTGSLWRGAFGHAFKGLVCGLPTPPPHCTGCPRAGGCPLGCVASIGARGPGPDDR